MSSGGDDDKSHDHLEVSQPNKARTKKSMRPIDVEYIPKFLSSASERGNTDTHLYVVPFETVDPQAYHTQYHRPHGASSTSQSLHPRRYDVYLQRLFVEHDPYQQIAYRLHLYIHLPQVLLSPVFRLANRK
uniref:Uncharacterized protein n=1 Tax=Solanum tuberosum TaxID=4113 RepID=M1DGB5_SOLTU